MKVDKLIETLEATYPDKKFGKMNLPVQMIEGHPREAKIKRLKTDPVSYFKTIIDSGRAFYILACTTDYIRLVTIGVAE